MRFRAILVVESEDIDILIKKMDALGNFKLIDVYDSKYEQWLMNSDELSDLLNKIKMRRVNA